MTFTKSTVYHPDLAMTPEEKVTGYNNFYEFGLDKADPAANAGTLKTEGWQIRIDGDVAKPMTLDIDDLIKRFPAGRTHLSHALRRSLVHGGAVDWF